MSQISPATLEGWYALHQVFSMDWAAFHALDDHRRDAVAGAADALLTDLNDTAEGWSASFRLVGGGGDLMLVHFRPSLDQLADAQLQVRRSALGPLLRLTYDYTSVTEAGLYSATVQAGEEAEPGTEQHREILDQLKEAERGSEHTRRRLYPEIPEAFRYVSFYPMTKRRTHPDNWYSLPVEERNALMREHGMTGRRFAGRILQVITGSMGLDDWEWGVTLFARDPLEFKRIVTDMRYDEASARYGEFGEFYVGVRTDSPGALLADRG
ncbi:MAG TPA: hydrogen peroxide-dependent heme synthase [Longimicrobiales bacterium]|nr:hydrogen peroxide-dependent heme synthase [Longimicrobiales bacterium]